MILTLDHVQRLALITGLDQLECKGRREAVAVCALQDRLDLSEEERAAIGLKKQSGPQGLSFYQWDEGKRLEPRNYELGADDSARILRSLDSFPIVLRRDQWYRELEKQLPPLESPNGQH